MAEQSGKDKWADAMQNVLDKFHDKSTFIQFAESSQGLGMQTKEISPIETDQRHNFTRLKLDIAGMWRQNRGQSDGQGTSSEKFQHAYERFIASMHHPSKEITSDENRWSGWKIASVVILAIICSYCCCTSKGVGQRKDETMYSSSRKSQWSCGMIKDKLTDLTCHCNLLEKVSNESRNILSSEDTIFPFDAYDSTVRQDNCLHENVGYSSCSSSSSEMPLVFDDLLELYTPSDESIVRHITLTGPRGSGKTEFLKSISRNILDEVEHLKNIRMVRYLDIQGMMKQNMTALELLFGNFAFKPSDAKHCLRMHSIEMLLIIDHIDDYITNASTVKALNCIDCVADVDVIVVNLIRGQILPDIKILTSLRYKMVQKLRGRMKPDKTVVLKGLSDVEVNKLSCWGYLKTIPISPHPSVLNFVMPTVQKRIFQSETDILLHALHQKFQTEDNANFFSIRTLMNISFELTKNDKDVFYHNNFDFPIEDLLMYVDLGLIKGSGSYRFAHQSIQDSLASLLVVNMAFDKFEEFTEELHTRRWMSIRKMVMEILLEASALDKAQALISPGKIELKRFMLKQSLQRELEKLQTSGHLKSDFLELLNVLKQFDGTAKEILVSSLQQISFVNVPLTAKELDTLLFSISSVEHMTLVNLINCQIDAEILKGLAESFAKGRIGQPDNTKVKILTLGNYRELASDSVEHVLHIMPYVSDILWLAYRINSEGIKAIQDKLDRVQKPKKIYVWTAESRRLVILASKQLTETIVLS